MGHYILQFYNYKSISTIIIIHCWYQTTLVYSTNDLSSGFDRRTTTCKRITFTSTNRGGSRINSGGLYVEVLEVMVEMKSSKLDFCDISCRDHIFDIIKLQIFKGL